MLEDILGRVCFEFLTHDEAVKMIEDDPATREAAIKMMIQKIIRAEEVAERMSSRLLGP